MFHRSTHARPLIVFLALLLVLSGLLPFSPFVHAADGGNGQPGTANQQPIGTTSTVSGFPIAFVKEYGKTSIFLRICSDAPNFQMRAENVGRWMTEVFHRTAVSGGCSPSTTSWWRMVYNIDPNTGELFRIFATANDTALGEAAFMQRAARTDCRVTGYGSGYCTPSNPAPVSVPMMALDEPGAGQTVQNSVTIRGWATDAGSLNGPGVTDVHVRLNGTFLGAATYGESRPDIRSYLGDSRFTNAGYHLSFDSRQFANGSATIQISYRSAITGNWHVYERQIFINNTLNQPPNRPSLVAPASGSVINAQSVTLQVQDTGDPDNGPRNYRDFFFVIERTDAPWSQSSGWRGNTWTVTLPGRGTYRWRAQSGDGAAASAWTDWATLISSVAQPTNPPVPPPPAPGRWNVPYYWQGDPQWGGNKIGACNNNIRNVGCALTSLAMIFRYYGVNHNPGTLNSCMGGYACPLSWGSSKVTTCSAGRVKWVSWPAFSYTRLEQELKKGPVILEISKSANMLHFIVVLGGSGSDPRNYIVNDPGVKNGARTTLSNSLAIFKGYRPSSMRIYTGTPGLVNSAHEMQDSTSETLLVRPQLSVSAGVTGTIELYRNTETELTLELAAQSSAGSVTEMQIWTDQQANDAWQPFTPYVNVPLDNIFYARFRDAAGNTSDVVSVEIPSAPESVQANLSLVYLPVTSR
jgi:hypothetical protein